MRKDLRKSKEIQILLKAMADQSNMTYSDLYDVIVGRVDGGDVRFSFTVKNNLLGKLDSNAHNALYGLLPKEESTD